MNTLTAYGTSWHASKKILFRFCFVYFFIYCFPFPLDAFEFTKPVVQPLYNFLDYIVPYLGERWFHLHAVVAFPMFDKVDDSNYGLVFLYLNLIVSAVAAATWSLLDQRRRNYARLYEWLRLYLRYFLAAYLFGYGFVKVFPSQFQAITASRLTLSIGEQSPMLLAWNFMGYSVVMMRVNGIAEVAAALLLLFRRTTTIGALLSASVFSFVVMMDFCFNVPVRLLASHLLIMSVFLTLRDGNKLLNVFFLNKATSATVYLPMVARAGWRKVFLALQVLLAISILYSGISSAVQAQKEYGWNSNPRLVPLYGVYNTIYFIRNSDTVPPLQTDSLRWKQFVIDGGNWKQSGIIELCTGNRLFCNVSADTVKKIISIQSKADTTEKYLLHYFMKDSYNIFLTGVWKGDSIKVLMNKYDLNNYPLHKEKFTWITN